MSSNTYYSSNVRENDGQNYTFSENPFCPSGSEQASNISAVRVVGSGLRGPGTHIEETTPSVASVSKSNGRGKRKQRKKGTASENRMGEQMKIEHPDEADERNINETSAGVHEIVSAEEVMYHSKACTDDVPAHDGQLLVNSNTLDQILSYKKMLLLQSPEVIEFLKNHQLNK